MNPPRTERSAYRAGLGLACLLLAAVWSNPAGAAPVRTREVRARVQRVVDGDTFVIGKGRGAIPVRLRCVDTPEVEHRDRRGEPYGVEARRFARQALEGQTVLLLIHEDEPRDRYDRLLAYVFLKDGTFVNAELVRRGLARTTRFPCLYRAQLKALQKEARKQRRGMWR